MSAPDPLVQLQAELTAAQLELRRLQPMIVALGSWMADPDSRVLSSRLKSAVEEAYGRVPMVFHLAICMKCTPTLPVPFHSEVERDQWLLSHVSGTGHSVVRDVEVR